MSTESETAELHHLGVKGEFVVNPVPPNGMENQLDRLEADRLKSRMIVDLFESKFGYCARNQIVKSQLSTD